MVIKPGRAAASLNTTPKWTPCLNCHVEQGRGRQAADVAAAAPVEARRAARREDDVLRATSPTRCEGQQGQADRREPRLRARPLEGAAGRRTASRRSASSRTTRRSSSSRSAQRYEPAFDALEAAGIKRAELALAFPFTTQSERPRSSSSSRPCPRSRRPSASRTARSSVRTRRRPTRARPRPRASRHTHIGKFFAGAVAHAGRR